MDDARAGAKARCGDDASSEDARLESDEDCRLTLSGELQAIIIITYEMQKRIRASTGQSIKKAIN